MVMAVSVGCYFELYLFYEDLLTMIPVPITLQAAEFIKTRILQDFPAEFPAEFLLFRIGGHREWGACKKCLFNAVYP